MRIFYLIIFVLFFATACETLPSAMLPDMKNIEGIEAYNPRGQLVSGRSCVPREEGGKVCTTMAPDGSKVIATYGPTTK